MYLQYFSSWAPMRNILVVLSMYRTKNISLPRPGGSRDLLYNTACHLVRPVANELQDSKLGQLEVLPTNTQCPFLMWKHGPPPPPPRGSSYFDVMKVPVELVIVVLSLRLLANLLLYTLRPNRERSFNSMKTGLKNMLFTEIGCWELWLWRTA